MRPTLLGQLSRAHVLVVVATCGLLVLATVAGSAVVLRGHQDRILEAIAIEVANGVEVEAAEENYSTVQGAEEYFRESRLEGFRFELLSKDGTVLTSDGKLPGWLPESYDIPVNAKAVTPTLRRGSRGSGSFRGCARWCGADYVLRVISTDVLGRAEVRRFAAVLLFALPLAVVIGAMLGRAVFRRRLASLGQLEAAAAVSTADPGVTLAVEADSREIATLRDAFNGLLSRLGEAFARERRFSQEASHELRTPLAALRARIERLEADGTLNATQRAHAATALHEVDSLDRLIDSLLLLARSESSPLPSTPVNLCDVAREVAGRESALGGAVVRTPEVDAPDEILVRGSEELLVSAVANLVENARKFAGAEARVRIRVAQKGKYATVAVGDDGPGIPASDRERVFERFFRAPTARGVTDGVGLGLAVVRAIALRHRGVVEAGQSDLGGAELTLGIPVLSVDGGDAVTTAADDQDAG